MTKLSRDELWLAHDCVQCVIYNSDQDDIKSIKDKLRTLERKLIDILLEENKKENIDIQGDTR